MWYVVALPTLQGAAAACTLRFDRERQRTDMEKFYPWILYGSLACFAIYQVVDIVRFYLRNKEDERKFDEAMARIRERNRLGGGQE